MADRAPMVGWYDPGQLLNTAVQVVVSTILGQQADRRLIEALVLGTYEPFDYVVGPDGQQRREIWIDYIADTGDGFDSTYAIARAVAQPELRLRAPDGAEVATRRGDILVFGGDEVYPTASRKAYKRRLIEPYRTALAKTDEPSPHVFAVPGNHDWYDSLVSFTRLFLSKDWFAGWKAPQERSYFALYLPHGWWLIGTDVQLGSDIDKPQVDYFRKVRDRMLPDHRVILCNAEPYWIYSHTYREYDAEVFNESNLQFLEDKVFQRKIDVYLAGDLHHYRRHEAADGRQKITSGGGGAFLHPTHGADVAELEGGYKLKSCFPDVATSRRLCWRNLLFRRYNFSFGLFPALLYLLTAWTTMANVGSVRWSEIGRAVKLTIGATLDSPTGAFWALLTFFGFVLFTDTHSRAYRWIMGSLHGLAHVAAAFFLTWGANYLCVTGLGWQWESIRQLALCGVLIFAGGWIAGSLIMGIYLLVSLNVFGRHANEAFSSLAIPDYKNFLRLHIDAEGNLTIFPVGIRRVARRWKDSPAGVSRLEPDDPRATAPQLIEGPVVLRRK